MLSCGHCTIEGTDLKRLLLGLLTAIALQGLAACTAPTTSPPTEGQSAAPHTETTEMLGRYHWLMEPAIDKNKKRESLRLTFETQRLSVGGLCNVLSAGYTLDGSKMTIKQVVGTMRLCDDPALMAYEQEVASRLPMVSSWSIAPGQTGQAPILTLKFSDKSQWNLQGEPTDETRYGSAGEIIFLEVAPQMAVCHHPLMPEKQCLNIRSVHYDAAGVKQAMGPWELFYDEIDGYEFVPGVRNILRVKRYERAETPEDASRYAYVLDMVVEQERTDSH